MPARSAILLVLLVALVFGANCDKATPVAPVGATITLSVNPARIEPSGEATVTALVRRSEGSPVNPGTEVNFTATLGELDPPTAATDERGIAETVLKGKNEVGMATISASSGAADATATVEVQIGALPFDIILAATPQNIPAQLPQGGVEIQLLATVTDDEGRLLNEVAVNFSAEIGNLTSEGAPVLTNTPCPADRNGNVTPAQEGVACDLLRVRQGVLDSVDAVFFMVEACAGSDLEVIANAEIGITGLVSFISLQATPSSVPETGGTLTLLALVEDDNGEPLEGVGVNFVTEVGTLASGGGLVRSNANGEATDRLTVTPENLTSLPTTATSFTVTGRTVLLDGTEATATFEVGIERAAPRADFTFTVNNLDVTFANASTGEEPLTFLWDFGDGTTSTERNPSVKTYAAPDTYQVSLTATNVLGSDTITKSVTVTDPGP